MGLVGFFRSGIVFGLDISVPDFFGAAAPAAAAAAAAAVAAKARNRISEIFDVSDYE